MQKAQRARGLSSAYQSNFFRSYHKFLGKSRHEICQKIYTAGFSGQKIYTLNFTEFQQFWWWKHRQVSENEEIYTTGKNFTLPPVATNLPSGI